MAKLSLCLSIALLFLVGVTSTKAKTVKQVQQVQQGFWVDGPGSWNVPEIEAPPPQAENPREADDCAGIPIFLIGCTSGYKHLCQSSAECAEGNVCCASRCTYECVPKPKPRYYLY